MANLAGIRNATFTFAFGKTLSTNETHREVFFTELFQSILLRDAATAAAFEMSNAVAGRLSLFDTASFAMAATAEGADPAASNFAPTNVDHTPARQAFRMDLGDDEVSRFTGPVSVEAAVASLVNMDLQASPSEQEIKAMGIVGEAAWWAYINRVMALVKALAGGFSNVSGVALNPITRVIFEAAVDAIIGRGNRGSLLWLDNSTAWGTVSTDYAALLGAGQYSRGAQIAIDRGPTQVTDELYRGCRHATVTGLPDNGAGSTYGCIIAPEAISLRTATPKLSKNAELVGTIGNPASPLITVERRREAGSTNVISAVCWLAIQERQDGGGQTLIHTT